MEKTIFDYSIQRPGHGPRRRRRPPRHPQRVYQGRQHPVRTRRHELDRHEAGDDIDRTAESYRYNPVPASKIVIDDQFVRDFIFHSIKYPGDVANMSIHWRRLVEHTELDQVAGAFEALGELFAVDNEAFTDIKCGDTFARYGDLDGGLAWELDYANMEHMAMQCARWQFTARERYAHDFHATTRKPILFVSNTYDMVTPPINACNMSAGFTDSIVVEQLGFGVSVHYLSVSLPLS
jgi:hypothetical protein